MAEYPKLQLFDSVGDTNNVLIGSPIASATTIAPDHGIHHVTGVAAIQNITVPWEGFSGTIKLIADGAWSLLNTGNINSAVTVATGDTVTLNYDPTAVKWFPILGKPAIASGLAIGDAVAGGGASRVLYEDAAQTLAANSGLTFDGTTFESSKQTNISGPDATTNVEIGSTANNANAGTGGTSVVIGNSATNSGNAAATVLIGTGTVISQAGATAGIAIGNVSQVTSTGIQNMVVGSNSVLSGTGRDAVFLGHGLTGGGDGAIAIGNGLSTTNGSAAVANTFQAGGAFPATNVYFGKGITNATATAYTINGTGGSGTDNAGAALRLAGGKGTGTAAGGNVILQASQRLATGTTAQTLYDRHVVVAGTKTLTAGAATGVVRIGIPQGLAGPVGCTIYYSVRAADATDFQLRRGSVHIAAVNKAGTVTAVVSGASELLDGSIIAASVGTLTYGLTITQVADDADFQINAVSSLTETTLDVQYTVIRDHGTGTITPL